MKTTSRLNQGVLPLRETHGCFGFLPDIRPSDGDSAFACTRGAATNVHVGLRGGKVPQDYSVNVALPLKRAGKRVLQIRRFIIAAYSSYVFILDYVNSNTILHGLWAQ